jgi:hypothetical protein
MPLATKAVQMVGNRLPKVISPKGHALVDYVQIGTLTVVGALLWRKNRLASVAALGCAALEAANALLTDYPGGVAKVLSFETHGRIDAALSGAMAGLPNLLGFAQERQAKLFRVRGGVTAAVTALTRFKIEQHPEAKAEPA